MKKKTVERKAGVLLNISSLPGPFGIGVFGKEAKDFADKLSEMNFGYWQILPLGNIDEGNSPYTNDSSVAGNYLYIDPRGLFEDGLLSKEDVEESYYDGSPYTVDYGAVFEKKEKVLRTAFNNYRAAKDDKFTELAVSVATFVKKKKGMRKYVEFRAEKNLRGGLPWWEWRKGPAIENNALREEQEYVAFVQYYFFKQWNEIKNYVNEKNVKIIGDMPVYVAMDSCDVWSNPHLFHLDEKGLKPTKVAGVPPDYFSKDGQLWGNPLYNWEKMKEENYKWWADRLEAALEIYDVLRIDHFRGLASYWAVPARAKTAKNGHWEKGPGQDLFDSVRKKYKDGEIIAEDLGVYGEDVVSLLKTTGFAQMRVVQFGFDGDRFNNHLPHNYPVNCVAYLGTHDNTTLLGWLWDISEEERKYVLRYCGYRGDNWQEGGYWSESCRAVTEAVWKSPARLTVIALQDMCGFGNDTRMNIPGVGENNWRYRATEETIEKIDVAYFAEINRVFGRD